MGSIVPVPTKRGTRSRCDDRARNVAVDEGDALVAAGGIDAEIGQGGHLGLGEARVGAGDGDGQHELVVQGHLGLVHLGVDGDLGRGGGEERRQERRKEAHQSSSVSALGG
jgi:hypothetical protein